MPVPVRVRSQVFEETPLGKRREAVAEANGWYDGNPSFGRVRDQGSTPSSWVFLGSACFGALHNVINLRSGMRGCILGMHSRLDF